MKVVILAGGLGTRISEYTKTIPKPMIPIKGKPLIYYIMQSLVFIWNVLMIHFMSNLTQNPIKF